MKILDRNNGYVDFRFQVAEIDNLITACEYAEMKLTADAISSLSAFKNTIMSPDEQRRLGEERNRALTRIAQRIEVLEADLREVQK